MVRLTISIPGMLECSPHELKIMLCAALAEYRARRCCGNAAQYVQEKEAEYSYLQNRSSEERQADIERRERQFADAEALRNAVASGDFDFEAPALAAALPCRHGCTPGECVECDG